MYASFSEKLSISNLKLGFRLHIFDQNTVVGFLLRANMKLSEKVFCFIEEAKRKKKNFAVTLAQKIKTPLHKGN